MKKEMLINVLQPEECRIAILEDSVLEELYVERTSHESYVGNIYKGRVVNIEPSIQAAFVDFGVGRNGFLHVSDVEPAYYRHLEPRRGDRGDRGDRGGRRGNGRDRERPRRPVFEEESPYPAERSYAEPEARGYPPEDVQPHAEEEHRAEAPPAEVHEVEASPEESAAREPGTPLVALPESMPDEDPGRSRRRPRGGGGRRRRGTPAEGEPEAGESAPESAPDKPERPPLMGSAERRTHEKDSGPDAPHEIVGASHGPGASADPDEDLLFFPRTPPPPPRQPEPEAWREEPFEREEEPQPAPAPAVRYEPEPPPRRARPQGPRGSLEDELAADLDAAEIEDVTPSYADEEGNEQPYEPDFGPEAEAAPPPPRMHEQRRDGEGGEGGRRDRHGRRDRRDRPNGGRRGGPGRPGLGRPKPLIQDIFRRGQEVLVQVIKEGIGTKGPTLSTYISIAGRYLVLMPSLNRLGVSRKIDDDEHRRRLREILNDLKPPRGLGFIIRTAAIDKNKKELQRDLAYLSRLWQVVVRRIRNCKAPAEIYQESDMITRTIRDTFTNDIDTIWVDEPNAFHQAQEFLQIVMPRFANRIKLYEGTEPLYHKHGIEEEIARIQMRKIPLPHGGSIVIEQTEALVAIDVNSGNFRGDRNDAEETAYQMNLHAAKEIARQLRLRDLGGVIVNDFIDMRDEKHRRAVEKAMRDAVKRDRARTKILKISAFGIIEMTRQRIRPSLKRSVYQDCPYCHGMAQVKTCESMSIDVMRLMQLAAHRGNLARVEVRVTAEVADYLLNKKRAEIARLEQGGNLQIQVRGSAGAPPETLDFYCYDNNNNEVKMLPVAEPVGRGRR